ncbi:zinc finger protein pita [Anabrus simplex]|uniref:zinc finger protein pita n=1 Tax=Anabrus simplex TaxID=316456 RepID=UPI0034DDC311
MKSAPRNMNDLCRLCLSESDGTLPIFGEEESGGLSSVPLSFRILACVSVEVSPSDGLPSLICKNCLNDINHWHEFKQKCDLAQATLKEWKNPSCTCPEKEVTIKQEVCDVEVGDGTVDITQDSGSVDIMV